MAEVSQASLTSNEMTDPQWTSAAQLSCRQPGRAIACPACRAEALRAEWNIITPKSREAYVDLKCTSCSAAVRLRFVLPWQALDFYPLTRIAFLAGNLSEEMQRIMEHVQRHEKFLPSAMWMLDPPMACLCMVRNHVPLASAQ